MSRSRKDYRVGHEPSPAADPSPEGLVVVFPDPAGGRGQRFDFGVHAERPVLAAELALVFRGQLADKSPETRQGAFSSGVRNWFRFLASGSLADRDLQAMSDVDTSVLRAFIAWLDRRPLTPGSRHTIWSRQAPGTRSGRPSSNSSPGCAATGPTSSIPTWRSRSTRSRGRTPQRSPARR